MKDGKTCFLIAGALESGMAYRVDLHLDALSSGDRLIPDQVPPNQSAIASDKDSMAMADRVTGFIQAADAFPRNDADRSGNGVRAAKSHR
jgi:hypothetical protein